MADIKMQYKSISKAISKDYTRSLSAVADKLRGNGESYNWDGANQ